MIKCPLRFLAAPPSACPGEGLLRLPDRGDRLGDEVYTTDVRDHRGQHPLGGHQSSTAAGLAGQTQAAPVFARGPLEARTGRALSSLKKRRLAFQMLKLNLTVNCKKKKTLKG